MTSGPIPSPGITAMRWSCFTQSPCASAAHTVTPAHVHFTTARRAAQLSRRRLPALRTEVHLTAAGERLAAVRALAGRLALLGELERRTRERRLFVPIFLPIGRLERFGRWCQGRWRWRRVGSVPPQEPLGGEPVETQDRVGELAEQGGVGIRLPDFAPQRVLDFGRLERRVAALAREQSQHRHLIALLRRHPEVLPRAP